MNFLNPLRGTSFAWVFPFTWRAIKWVAAGVPVTIEVFLHHRFGSRTGLVLLKGAVPLLLLTMALAEVQPPLFPTFVGTYICLAIFHWLAAQLRSQNEHVHSYGTGEPWFCGRFTPATVERYLEPSYWFIVAMVVQLWDPVLTNWLVIASTSLFIKGQVRRARVRTRHLDLLDGRIETNQVTPSSNCVENERFVEARPALPAQQQPRRETPRRRRRI